MIKNTWNDEVIWQRKKLMEKTKNGENVSIFEVVKLVLVQCNIVQHQYQEKS